MAEQPYTVLNDGRRIPQLGLGVFKTAPDLTAQVVETALKAGYRSVDTAAIYKNEAGVGEGLKRSGLPRDEVFLTTKLWNDRQGFDETLKAFDESARLLGVDEIDLYLIHWPAPTQDKYVDSWKALIRLKEEGRARSIGVSNFYPAHLEQIIAETGVVPVANQVELHPGFQQDALRATHAKHGIATESWSPLGQGKILDNPVLAGIAARHGKSVAQIIIRWHLDQGLVVIPKSENPARIAANFDVFDFHLDGADLSAIAKLDDAGGRIGPDPMKFG